MKFYKILFASLMLAGCSALSATTPLNYYNYMETALSFKNYNERTHTAQLKEFLLLDPTRVEWCAEFINAVLEENNIDSLNTPDASQCSQCEQGKMHPYPLAARSFLHWGMEVTGPPQYGDIVVFPRGSNTFNGHAGFYMGSVYINNKHYYQILGGNQNKQVSLKNFRANRALGIRRPIR